MRKKKILIVFLGFLLSISMPFKALALDDKESRVAEELAIKLSLGLRNKVFQGAIFSQTLSAWRIQSEHGFDELINALSKQTILNQYQALANVITLSGEYAHNSVLLQIERTSLDGYQGSLSIMPLKSTPFSYKEEDQLHRFLIREATNLIQQKMLWLPKSSELLMDIEIDTGISQQIYLISMTANELREILSTNLKLLGWRKNDSEDLGFSVWSRNNELLKLYFSDQKEGTALYVSSRGLSKEVYESSY